MDDFRIKIFRVLASNLDLSKAGQVLCLSRQTVTQHVRALEEELGTPLFVRKENSIALTAGGQVLLSYAEKIESLCRDAQTAVVKAGGAKARCLALGASTAIAQHMLSDWIEKFAAESPHISIAVSSGNTDSMLTALMEGQIQLAIVEQPLDCEDVHVETFLQSQMVLVVPPNHEWAGCEIDACRLKGEPFLMREVGSGSRRTVEAALAHAGVAKQDLTVVMEFDSTDRLLNAVEAGLGIAIVSQQEFKNRNALGEVRLAQVHGLRLSSSMFIVSRAAEPLEYEAAMFRQFLLDRASTLTGGNLYVLPRTRIDHRDKNVAPMYVRAEQML